MYTPLAAEIVRRETRRAARSEPAPKPQRQQSQPAVVRRALAALLRRSADRLAPEC